MTLQKFPEAATQPPLHKTKCLPHQMRAYDFAMPKRGTYLGLKMGEMKSKITIDIAVNSGAKTMLIVAPARVLNVWQREFEYHCPIPYEITILSKKSENSAAKVKRAADALIVAKSRDVLAVIVVSYETAIRPEFRKFALSRLWDVIAADEAHKLKQHNGKAGKLFGELGNVGKKKLCLSGTPLPHSPLDAFSQYRFLDSRIFNWSYTKFRQVYAKMNPIFPSKVDAWLNQADFETKLKSIMFRCDEDVLNLPPYTDQTLTCELSPAAKRIYEELEEQWITEVEAGIVTAANALVKLLRLQQACAGFVKTEEGIEQTVDDAKERLLIGMLEDIAPEDPVVVFGWFKHDLETFARIAETMGRLYAEVSGDRSDLTAHAKLPDWARLVGVQLQSGGVGVDFTAARYGFWFCPTFNWALMEQSLKRLHRPGQTKICHFYRIVAENTVDRAVYGALKKREELVNGVLAWKDIGGDQELVSDILENL
jgi:SNF2 family DNA or RNA helicase